MANKVFINNDGVIECQVIGDQTLQSVTAMGEEIGSLAARLDAERRPLLVLDDISHIGSVPPDARKKVIQFVKTVKYNRLAMFGGNGLIRVGANLILRASGKSKKLKYFTNRSQAIVWLREPMA